VREVGREVGMVRGICQIRGLKGGALLHLSLDDSPEVAASPVKSIVTRG